MNFGVITELEYASSKLGGSMKFLTYLPPKQNKTQGVHYMLVVLKNCFNQNQVIVALRTRPFHCFGY